MTNSLNTIERLKRFSEVIIKFDSDIDVIRDRYIVDGKSVLGILSIDLRKPLEVEIHSNNEDEIRKFDKKMKEFEVQRWEK